MKISIIQMIGVSAAQRAWQFSRDVTQFPPVDTVASIDAPVAEMPCAVLHFQDFCIIEREIFLSARNHVAWARTSRVDDPLQFRTPPSLQHGQHEAWRENMRQAAENGVAQDIYRMHLPVVALTNWTARISYRDICKMCLYFNWLAGQVYSQEWAERLRMIRDELQEIVACFVGPLGEHALLNFKQVTLLNNISVGPDAMKHGRVMEIGGFKHVLFTGTFALRAQLIRHRELIFRDTLLSMVTRLDVRSFRLGTQMDIEAMASTAVWDSIISKRSCWIADDVLWQPVLAALGAGVLPCKDGVCPYKPDAELRLTAADPGAPCPRYCNLYNVPKGPHLSAMQREAAHKPAFWQREIDVTTLHPKKAG